MSDQYIQMLTRYLQLNIPQASPNQNLQSWNHLSPAEIILMWQHLHPFYYPRLINPSSFYYKSPSLLKSTSSQVFLESIYFHPSPPSLSKTANITSHLDYYKSLLTASVWSCTFLIHSPYQENLLHECDPQCLAFIWHIVSS